MNLQLLLFILSCFLIIGCYSPSKYYSAKTVGDSEFDLGLSVDYVNNSVNYSSGNQNITESYSYGSIGVLGRYGINEKSDIGGYINSNGFIGIDYRYQILGDRNVDKFFVSTGPAYSLNVYTLSSGGFHELSLPFYMSYYFNDFISFTITPRISVHGIGLQYFTSEFGFYSTYGVTTGFEFGDGPLRTFLGFNYQQYSNNLIENNDSNPVNYSIGASFRYRFGEK